MSTRDPNAQPPPEGGDPTRYLPDQNPYEIPPTTQVPVGGSSDPTRVNPAGPVLPPLPPAPAYDPLYEPTQATPVPPTSTLGGPPTGTYGGGTPPPPPAGGAPWGRTPLPWILGGVGALLLLALVVFFVTRPSGGGISLTPTPTVMPTALATATPAPAVPTPTLAVVVPPTLEPSPTVVLATATPAPPSATPLPVPATVTTAPLPPTLVPPSLTPIPLPPSPTAVPPPPSLTPVPPLPSATVVPASPTPVSVTVVPATIVLPPSSGSPTPSVGGASTPPATPPVPATQPPAVSGSLTVQWFGQSGVLLITPDGNTILVDPPSPASGYTLPFLGMVNALLISRDDPDYNYQAAANSDNVLIAAHNGQFVPLDAQLSDAHIQAVQSQSGSDQAGPNGVWVIDSPGLYMVHLGGLKGPLPQSPLLRPQPDVLFLPVGGGSVLDATAAAQIVTQLKPKVVIPIHYKTPASVSPLAPVDAFLAGYRDVIRPGHTWTVKPPDLKGTDAAQPRIVVLDYK